MTMTHGPVVIRRRLGFVLKQLRGRRGLHLDVVARQLEISPSKLSRLETGQVEPKIRDVRDLLDIYGAGAEDREQIMGWATEAKSPGWWQPFSSTVSIADFDMYNSLEAEARSEQMFSTPVTGLLQTEAYARSILSEAYPEASEQELDQLVTIRIGRQAVIEPDRTDAPALELHAVLDESALRRSNAEPPVMTEQLQRLVQRSGQPNVRLQVLPFSAGYTRATSTFAIFEPRETGTDWPVVNVESTGSDAYFDTATEVSNYRSIWKSIVSRALDPDQSRRFIENLIDE